MIGVANLQIFVDQGRYLRSRRHHLRVIGHALLPVGKPGTNFIHLTLKLVPSVFVGPPAEIHGTHPQQQKFLSDILFQQLLDVRQLRIFLKIVIGHSLLQLG